mmetsp:Transcript_3746/g.7989  ORF Transcript_3746/g.7989 Transcript_3746/m.7989 type:complete len:205 (-) Transcript_3746:123-737(-)
MSPPDTRRSPSNPQIDTTLPLIASRGLLSVPRNPSSPAVTPNLQSLVNNLHLSEHSSRCSRRHSSHTAPLANAPPDLLKENDHSGARNAVPSFHSRMAEREEFLVFVRILLKCLDGGGRDNGNGEGGARAAIRLKARQIIRECTARNRAGDPEYTPLVSAVRERLRGVVGEMCWGRAEQYLRHYHVMRSRMGSAPKIRGGVSNA